MGIKKRKMTRDRMGGREEKNEHCCCLSGCGHKRTCMERNCACLAWLGTQQVNLVVSHNQSRMVATTHTFITDRHVVEKVIEYSYVLGDVMQ